jgi:hypothetical protein
VSVEAEASDDEAEEPEASVSVEAEASVSVEAEEETAVEASPAEDKLAIWKAMKISELKEECEKKGLNVKGTRETLIRRLNLQN